MRCPSCNADAPAGAAVCSQCGASIGDRCPSCRAVATPGAKFCSSCGRPLRRDGQDTSEVRPPDRDAAYTPAHLTREVLTTRAALEGERKVVTVLFCDLCGSTALAERIGAEAMHRLLDDFFKLALREVHRYGGTINQFLGDGFMALFGAPMAHEDHAVRAAHAALAILQTAKAKSDDALSLSSTLQVRMGMNTGPVVVGKIGDDLRMDYTAIGDTTNLAARLQQNAPPGEVYLTDATYRAIQHRADCDYVAQLTLKGKSRPTTAYRLQAVHPLGPARLGRPLLTAQSPLVGRQRECQLLGDRLRLLRDGVGGVVGIVGDAGVGKSRLIAEVRRLHAPDLHWLEGRALSFGQAINYGPFVHVLQSLAGITEQDSREEARDKLQSWSGGLLGEEAPAILPYLATMLGQPPRDEPAAPHRLDAKDLKAQLFISAWRLLQTLAQREPVVLEMEDWHWADDASARLLEHLIALTQTLPVLICFTGRPDPGTPCDHLRRSASEGYPQHYTEVVLGPLSKSDSNQLIDSLIPLSDLPSSLRGMILEKAEGNPFFIEEIVRSLVSAGVLYQDSRRGTWHIARTIDEIALPDTVEGVIMARIDRLEEDVKQLTKVAAVIGRTFYRRVLDALEAAHHELDSLLGQLEDLELIRRRRHLPEVEYMFKHALVQEAAYSSILTDRRRQLHRQVGECVERLFADRLGEFAGVLAYHFARAEDWEKAQQYLLLAGDQALRVAADVEALQHYRQGIAAYASAFGDRWDPLQRASLERKIGEALFRLGRHEEAAEQFAVALERLGVPFPSSAVSVRWRIVLELLGQLRWMGLGRRHLAERAEPTTMAQEEIRRVYVSLGLLDYFRNPERFLLAALAGLNWAERGRLLSGIAEGSTGVGVICDVLRLYRLGSLYHRRAARLAKTARDPYAAALSLYGIAFHELYKGRWGAAVRYFARSVERWEGTGAVRELGIALVTLAWIVRLRGELSRAAVLYQQLNRLATEAGDDQLRAWVTGAQAARNVRDGRLEEARVLLEQGVHQARSIADYQSLAAYLAELAECCLYQGDTRKALTSIDESARLIQETRMLELRSTYTAVIRAQICLSIAEHSSEGTRRVALARANQACRRAVRAGKRFVGIVPRAFCAMGSAAWLSGRDRAARRSWSKSLAMAQHLGLRFDLAATHREIGRLAQDRQSLELALHLFEELDASFDMVRTLRYLGEAEWIEPADGRIEWFERALKLLENQSAWNEAALTWAGYARLCQALERKDEAHRALERVRSLVEQHQLSSIHVPESRLLHDEPT